MGRGGRGVGGSGSSSIGKGIGGSGVIGVGSGFSIGGEGIGGNGKVGGISGSSVCGGGMGGSAFVGGSSVADRGRFGVGRGDITLSGFSTAGFLLLLKYQTPRLASADRTSTVAPVATPTAIHAKEKYEEMKIFQHVSVITIPISP